jgi:hypothetical protein
MFLPVSFQNIHMKQSTTCLPCEYSKENYLLSLVGKENLKKMFDLTVMKIKFFY